jgi:hypothetical protein
MTVPEVLRSFSGASGIYFYLYRIKRSQELQELPEVLLYRASGACKNFFEKKLRKGIDMILAL